MRGKAVIGLVAVALLALMLLLRGRPLSIAPAHRGRDFGTPTMNYGKTTASIDEFRQIARKAIADNNGDVPAANARAFDDFIASLRAQYGEEVPVVEGIKRLKEFQRSLRTVDIPNAVVPLKSQVASISGAADAVAEKSPDGVRFEWTPGGFLLHASCRDLFFAAIWAVFVGCLCAIPFVLWGNAIRDALTDRGPALRWTCLLLAVWACPVLYVGWFGAIKVFGEIRIAKSGDRGEIFTGIGPIGRTHHLLWSEFNGVRDLEEVRSTQNSKSSTTTHYVELTGTSKPYKFASELSDERRAFVIAFLREHVYGLHAVPPQAAPALGTSDDGKTATVEHIRLVLEQAKAEYHGPDPEGFNRSMDQFVESLRMQYGERIPIRDAVRRLEQLARTTGAHFSFSF
jgi:hypothetical protein